MRHFFFRLVFVGHVGLVGLSASGCWTAQKQDVPLLQEEILRLSRSVDLAAAGQDAIKEKLAEILDSQVESVEIVRDASGEIKEATATLTPPLVEVATKVGPKLINGALKGGTGGFADAILTGIAGIYGLWTILSTRAEYRKRKKPPDPIVATGGSEGKGGSNA